MTEILSQKEINDLLITISTGEVETADYTAQNRKKEIKIYDFRRPDRFSKDHIRTLQMMHETFARLSSTMLSARTRTVCSVHVVSVDQLTYEEFIRSVPNPTLMCILTMNPLAGAAVMEIDPGITFSIIQALAGGQPEASRLSREHTDIELMLMEDIFNGLAANLRYAWCNVVELEPEVANLETNPQFAQIVPPNDMIVLVTLEAKIDYIEGMMNIAIPYITLEPVIERFSAKYMFTAVNSGRESATAARLERASYKRRVVYSRALANMTPDEIRKLKPGIKIPLEPEADAKVVYEYAGTGEGGDND